MNIIVLDKKFQPSYILDTYESLIWVDRYNDTGDFEIYTPLNSGVLNNLKEGYYLQIADSYKTMIIERIEISSDFEGGSHLIISGRSLESILDRRVILPKQTVQGSLQTNIKNWLTEAFISPTSSIGTTYSKLRKLSNFKFQQSTDPDVTSSTISKEEIEGAGLLDTIAQKCQEAYLGFEIVLDENNNFVFQLYSGADRSASQMENKLVLFSDQYGNVSSSDFSSDATNFKNFIILKSEKVGTKYYGNFKGTGLNHREYFESSNAETASEADYYGNLDVYHNGREISITAEVDPNNRQFVYNRDYFLGDIVEVGSELVTGRARVTEYTINITESGKEYYPTFEFFPDYDGGDDE